MRARACVCGLRFQESGVEQGPQSGVIERLVLGWSLQGPGYSRMELKEFWLMTGTVLGVRQKWDSYQGIYRECLLGPRSRQYCEL